MTATDRESVEEDQEVLDATSGPPETVLEGDGEPQGDLLEPGDGMSEDLLPIPDAEAERCASGEPVIALSTHWSGLDEQEEGFAAQSGPQLEATVSIKALPEGEQGLWLAVSVIADDGCDTLVVDHLEPIFIEGSTAISIDVDKLGVRSDDMDYAGSVTLSIGVLDGKDGAVVDRSISPMVFFYGSGSETTVVGEGTLISEFAAGRVKASPQEKEAPATGEVISRVMGSCKPTATPPVTEDEIDAPKYAAELAGGAG